MVKCGMRNSEFGIEDQHSAFCIPHSEFRGQTALEYALFIAVVSAALIAMNGYVRRSIQANLKMLEDNINAEAGAPVNLN